MTRFLYPDPAPEVVNVPPEDADGLYRLIYAITHPESVEGWEEEGTDTSMETNLHEAGFGSGGIL